MAVIAQEAAARGAPAAAPSGGCTAPSDPSYSSTYPAYDLSLVTVLSLNVSSFRIDVVECSVGWEPSHNAAGAAVPPVATACASDGTPFVLRCDLTHFLLTFAHFAHFCSS